MEYHAFKPVEKDESTIGDQIKLISKIDSCFLLEPTCINKGLELSSNFLSKYKKQYQLTDTSIAHVMNVMANFYHMENSFDSAIYYYKEAKIIYDFHNIQNSNVAYFLYRPLGILYHKTGAFQEAINLLNSASIILVKNNSTRLAAIYSEIGNIYQTTGNHPLAIKYYQNAMNIKPIAKWMQSILHENIGLSLVHLEKYNDAEVHLKKALDLALKTEDDIGIISVLSVLGQMFYRTDHIEEAISYISLALEKSNKISSVDKREVAKIKYLLGVYLLESGDADWALREFESMLNTMQADSDITHLKQSYVLDPWFMISYKSIAKSYDMKYQQSKKVEHLKKAFKFYEKSHQTASLLRKSYQSNISKLFLSEQTNDLYKSAVENCFKLYQKTNDTTLIYKALQYSEYNKFQLLYEQIVQQVAFDTLNISNSIKKTISDLNFKIARLKKDVQILEKKNNQIPLDSLQKLKFSLSNSINQLQNHEARLLKSYGLDFINNLVIDETEIRKYFILHPNECIIEFLTSDSSVFVFYLDHSGLKLKQVNPKTNGIEINQLIKQIRNRPKFTADLSKTSRLIKSLNSVYNLILRDYLAIKGDQIDHLIIVPDQYWSYLPFEALVIDNDHKDWFNPENFLIQNYSFTYSGSMALFFHSENRASNKYESSYSGFAPVFKPNEGDNSINNDFLEYSKLEINSANSILNGKTYLNEHASLTQFKNELKKSQIIHLATHSEYDSLVPMNSRLYFSDTILQLYEIYQMKSNAQLVILNACNTGIGKQYSGEGNMSISNGFLESGTKACIMNLWSVDDYSTSRIISLFISHLKNNQATHKSLQQAKISFLENSRKVMHHPFYWASNVLSSRRDLVYKERDNSMRVFLVGVFMVLTFLGLFLLRKKFKL